MTPHQIIVRPIVTEKSNDLMSYDNQYVFEVHKRANKIEIGKSVALLFGVKVEKVRTMVVRGDLRRVGKHHGRRRSWKKAIVTLNPSDSIDLYGGEQQE